MIIEYKGLEKRIDDPVLIEIFETASDMGNKNLIIDIKSALINHDIFNVKLTFKRLESAFQTACYSGVYEAFELEMYCKERQY